MKRSLSGLALALVFLAGALPGRAAEPATSLQRDNGVAILAGISSPDVFFDITLSPLEPVLKLLESDESFVIPSPVSIRGGHWHVACGKSCKV